MWYIAGNFFFGGIIGWFIVDPQTGAMYTLSSQVITSVNAENKSDVLSHNNDAKDRISIVLLEDVPKELRAKMQKVEPKATATQQ